MDWNGDGNFDWKDDAFLHTVIQSEDSAQGGGSSSPSSSSSGNGFGWVIILAVLAFLSFFF